MVSVRDLSNTKRHKKYLKKADLVSLALSVVELKSGKFFMDGGGYNLNYKILLRASSPTFT